MYHHLLHVLKYARMRAHRGACRAWPEVASGAIGGAGGGAPLLWRIASRRAYMLLAWRRRLALNKQHLRSIIITAPLLVSIVVVYHENKLA